MVSAKYLFRSIDTYTSLWLLTLVSANNVSRNLGHSSSSEILVAQWLEHPTARYGGRRFELLLGALKSFSVFPSPGVKQRHYVISRTGALKVIPSSTGEPTYLINEKFSQRTGAHQYIRCIQD